MRFDKKVAVVTGGASGIGAATARLFAAGGASVVIADLNVAAGEAIAAELDGAFIRTDVTDEDQVEAAVALAVSRFGGLDIMVNNAGLIGAIGSLLETSLADWRRTQDVLLDAVFLGTKHAGRVMAPRGSGVILSVSSVAGLRGGLGPHAYTAAKHGVIGLTVSAASELSRFGIRVNAVAPSATVTPLIERGRGTEGATESSRTMSPLGKPILAEDIAEALAYLASDAAASVSGQVIALDAGLTTAGNKATPFHEVPASFLGGTAG